MPLVPRRSPFQLFRQEFPADPDVELGGYTSDDDNADIDHNPKPSASNTPSVDSNSDSDSNGDTLEDKVANDESQRDISWVLDSDDQDEDEADQQDPAQRHIPDSQSSEHGFGDYYASDENEDLLDESVLADDRSGSSETVFQAFEGGDSPSPRPSPPLHYHEDYDSEPHAPSRPGLITISDTEAESEQSEPSPGTLSPQSAGSSPAAAAGFLASASSSQGSRLGPSGPLDREPFRRRRRPRPDLHGPQSDVEEDVDFYNVPPSTRRPSLTPVLQPNRRLPRHSNSPAIARYQDFDDNPAINDLLEEEWNIQQSPPANAANAAYHNFDDLVGLSDSSEDEPLVQRPHRYLGIERTRRPRPLVILDHSDEYISDDEVNRLDQLPNLYRQRIPNVPHNENDHSVQGSDSDHVEEQPDDRNEEELDREFWPELDLVDEEPRDSPSQSDQEDLPDNLSLSEESQADESGAEQSSIQSDDSESEDDDDDDDVDEAFRAAVIRQEQQQRRDVAFPPLAGAAAVRETVHRLEQSLARLAERPDLQARVRRVAYGLGMDGDDDLVEMWFHDVDERQRVPRQNNARQNNQAPNNHGRAVEVIDLTEEPDSPVLHHRAFQNADLAINRRHRSRTMAQNGRQPPSLPRNQGDFQVIDLTGDDNPVDVDAGYPESDDDDGLFVPQHRHIPANRRLPHPYPPAVPFNRRFDNVRLFLGNVVARIPGMPVLQGEDDAFVIGPGPPYGINPNPLADNPPEFNYQANGFADRPQPPKPQFEEPPAARPGFTRNTGPDPVTGEDQVFVCASCDNELMYHEDSGDERPAKKAKKTKREREEHHFWAVKACGHVSTHPFPFGVILKSCLLTVSGARRSIARAATRAVARSRCTPRT